MKCQGALACRAGASSPASATSAPPTWVPVEGEVAGGGAVPVEGEVPGGRAVLSDGEVEVAGGGGLPGGRALAGGGALPGGREGESSGTGLAALTPVAPRGGGR